jgi:hypothetical protein
VCAFCRLVTRAGGRLPEGVHDTRLDAWFGDHVHPDPVVDGAFAGGDPDADPDPDRAGDEAVLVDLAPTRRSPKEARP